MSGRANSTRSAGVHPDAAPDAALDRTEVALDALPTGPRAVAAAIAALAG